MPSLYASEAPAPLAIPISNGSGVIDPDWLGDQSVVMGKLYPIANNTVLGNTSGAPAVPSALTSPVLTSLTLNNPAATAPILIVSGNTAAAPTVPHKDSIQIVGKDDAFAALYIDSFSDTPTLDRSVINLRVARGTCAAPTQTLAGDEMARISGRGYGLTGFTGSLASISFNCAENTTDTAQGASLDVRTTALGTVGGGSTTVPPIVARFQPSGGFSLGNAAFVATDPGAGCITASGTLRVLRAGLGVAPDASAALNVTGCSIFNGAVYDATRTLVINGNVRVSDQNQTVSSLSNVGTVITTQRIMFHAWNATPWTPTVSTDLALNGFVANPRIAATATTFSSQAVGFKAFPQIVSSDVGARISLVGFQVVALRNVAADLSAYASNSLIGGQFYAGHYLGPPSTIVSGTSTAVSAATYNCNGTITTAYGLDIDCFVGAASGSANPVIGTYYGLRLRAPTLVNGGTITNNWAISQEDTTAKIQFLGKIVADINCTANISNRAGSMHRFYLPDDSNYAFMKNFAAVGGAAYVSWGIAASSNDPDLLITDYGKVLIGTTTLGSLGQKLLVNGSIATAAPSGGIAAAWKLGGWSAGVVAQAGKVRVEIGGTPYDLLTA